jgi:beta-lactam-binding protein with PASTA domain
MSLEDAKHALLNAGYTLGNITPTTEGAGGKVVRTEPFAGTAARPGTPVNIYINSASAQPAQP